MMIGISEIFCSQKERYELQFSATSYGMQVYSLLMCGIVVIGWNLMSPSTLAVAINAGFTFSFVGTFIIQYNVELETRMTSYQRIRFQTINLPQELSYVKNRIKSISQINNLSTVSKCQAVLKQEMQITQYDLNPQVRIYEDREIIPGCNWPETGRIQFKNVTFRQRHGLPFVLKDVSFDLLGGEKIGV
ncbi:MAG: hypothetical protein EZS28_046696 [Streblomastix strix]|uniref:ABC transmembrane type-1 domain-containing protein n=1 Tax=Streblomastix strix TaxID=222440 RepID=A0A5J4THR8_9EUKA|nr:MAG: hypothetical protein EZS28_046696 [Streblomastix strix]